MSTNVSRRSSVRYRILFLIPSLTASWLWLTLAIQGAVIADAAAQSTAEFHQTLMLNQVEPVTLDVQVPSADVQIVYSRDGEVSINATAQASNAGLNGNYFKAVLIITLNENHLELKHVPNSAYPEAGINLRYRIDVPYRTQVTAKVDRGKQTISGIMGPVRAVANRGDIQASYVSRGVQAETRQGNLDFRVIGERVGASTGTGNISGERLGQGITAETGDGDITLMVVGPSAATIKTGTGRIEIGGARGSLAASADGGDIHVKAIPHEDWRLNSASGTIRLELPPTASFDLEASTDSGTLQMERDDIAKPESDAKSAHLQVNGGGRRVVAQTMSGRIVIR
jgi:hypothetical protein